MQHRHADGQGVSRACLLERLDLAEFHRDALDGVHEGGLANGQVQIPAQADPVHALAQQRAAGGAPIVQRVLFGMAALGEGGQPAQAHGEQVGMQANLVGRHLRARAQAALEPGENALDQPVKADAGKALAVGLQAHPAVVVEHVGLLAVLMHDVHQRPGLFRHEGLDKVHVVPLVGGGGHMGHLQFPLVDKVLGGQGVAVLRFKGPERRGGHGEIVAGPVGVAVAAAHIAAEDPHEVVE